MSTLRRHRTPIVALYFALLAAACGDGGGSPTAPTPAPAQIPNVAGTYTGTVDYAVNNIAVGSHNAPAEREAWRL